MWMATLGVANGGGLLNLLNTLADAENPQSIVDGFYSSLWLFATGMLLAGAMLFAARRMTSHQRTSIERDAVFTDFVVAQLEALKAFQETARSFPTAVETLDQQLKWLPRLPGTNLVDMNFHPTAAASFRRAQAWKAAMEWFGYGSGLVFILGVAWPLVTLRFPSQTAFATLLAVARDWLPTIVPFLFAGLGFWSGLRFRAAYLRGLKKR